MGRVDAALTIEGALITPPARRARLCVSRSCDRGSLVAPELEQVMGRAHELPFARARVETLLQRTGDSGLSDPAALLVETPTADRIRVRRCSPDTYCS